MPMLDRETAAELLYAEARLLDDARYDDWLGLLTADILYWIPCNGPGRDPSKEIAIAYDDQARLRDRVGRLGTGLAHAQSPPSKTQRLISNIQVDETGESEAQVVSAFVLYELRRGRERILAGRYEHRVRFADGGWKIAAKKILLVNNDEVIDNLTFIV